MIKSKSVLLQHLDIQKEEEEDLKAVATLNEKPVIIRKPITIDDSVKRVGAKILDS